MHQQQQQNRIKSSQKQDSQQTANFNSPDNTINEQTNITFESNLLSLIFENQIEELSKLQLHLRDLNFLEEFIHIPLDNKTSPLILACYLGRYEIVKLLLLNENLNIDFGTDDCQYTALMVSCMSGYYEIASLLIVYGADVNKANAHGQIPLLFCFTRLEEDRNHFENTRICMKMAEILLENGADIDKPVNITKGYSILMVFCSVKQQLNKREEEVNYQMIKFLLIQGADKFKKSLKNKNCFDIAANHCNCENVIELLQKTTQKYFYKNSKLISENNKQQNLKPIKETSCRIEKKPDSKQQCCTLFQWLENLMD